jgi:hypothetical protein
VARVSVKKFFVVGKKAHKMFFFLAGNEQLTQITMQQNIKSIKSLLILLLIIKYSEWCVIVMN